MSVPGWSAEVRRDDGALRGLAAEWRDLYARSPAATPFQSHAWLESWWTQYGAPGRLRVVLVRSGGRLVAAAPLVLGRRWGCPVLTPLAAPLSDFTDVLYDPSADPRALDHLARALLCEPGWTALDFPEARPGSAAHALLRRWPRQAWRMPASVCLDLPAGDLDTFLDRLPGRSAGKMRARLRKADARQVTAAAVPAERAVQAVGALLDLHVRQWQDRPINPEHTRGRFRRHLAGALVPMIREGQAELFEYRHEGRLVASDLVVVGHGFVGAYLYGADPALRRIADVSLLLLREILDSSARRGMSRVSLLRGEEPYKMKWRPVPVPNERLVLARSSGAHVYAAVARSRAFLASIRHNPNHP